MIIKKSEMMQVFPCVQSDFISSPQVQWGYSVYI